MDIDIENIEERNYNCALLHMVRTSLTVTSNVIFIAIIYVRFFYVVYADFGFVIKGKLNTKAMHNLYIIICITFSIIIFIFNHTKLKVSQFIV